VSAPVPSSATPPNKRLVYAVVIFFLVGGLGLIAVGTYTWHDEQSGARGTAHIYQCLDTVMRSGGLSCDARWVVNGRTVTGYVENPKKDQLGKDVSVRIHGHHVTETSYWVPIGLWVLGLFVVGTFSMVLLQFRRRNAQPT
jgi:hypothetical protein